MIPDHVIVSRLVSICPVPEDWSLRHVLAAEPVGEYIDPHASLYLAGGRVRDRAYDLGRVHHFILQLKNREITNPIVVDTRWGRPRNPGPPFVWDGRHRLAAHYLINKRRVACSYSGPVDTLEWLLGKRRWPPEHAL